MGGPELRSLTGIRGLAAMAVVFYHLRNAMEQRFGLEALNCFSGGYMAVDLFFVLSGFVLSYNYFDLFCGGIRRRDYVDFIVKRIARLYPLYIVLTFVYFFKNTAGGANPYGGDLSIADWLLNLTMMHSWGFDTPRLLGVSWSISTEFLVYFLFPFIVHLLGLGSVAGLSLAVLSSAAIVAIALSGQGVSGNLDVVGTGSLLPALRCLAEFSLGVLSCQAVRRRSSFPVNGSNVPSAIAGIAVVAALYFRLDVVAVFLFPPCVALLSLQTRCGAILFAGRPVHYLGEISYSIYLVHFLCINPALSIAAAMQERHGIPLLATAIAVAGAMVVVASAALHRMVEIPGGRLFLQIGSRSRGRAAASV